MPLLFVSYKRGDATIDKIVSDLEKTNYRVWRDIDDISVSDTWRDKIKEAIERSAGIVLLVNSYSCKSQVVQEEINYARKLGKTIFPVKTGETSSDDLEIIGLNEVHCGDFTLSGNWDKAMAELLQSLESKDIKVTRHDMFEIDKSLETQFQYYLTRLKTKIGYVRLANISNEQIDIPLEEIYVPIPTNLSLNINVKDFRIIDWSIDSCSESSLNQIKISDSATLDSLISDIEKDINIGIDYKYAELHSRPLIFAPPWYDGIKKKFWILNVVQAAAAFDRLVVLGSPGSGKSTIARYLALSLIEEKLKTKSKNTNLFKLRHWPHGFLIPIFIELRQFVNWVSFPELGKQLTENHFWTYIKEEILGKDLEGFESSLKHYLINGQALIILDGLDEVPMPSGRGNSEKRINHLKDLAQILDTVYGQCRIIFTSRPYGYEGWRLENFQIVNLMPLDTNYMHMLSKKLFRQRKIEEIELEDKVNGFLEALKKVPRSLKDRPLFFTLMAVLFLMDKESGLPNSRGELYHQSIMLLLFRWTQPRLGDHSISQELGCDVTEIYKRIEVIAYRTHWNSTFMNKEASNIEYQTLATELFKLGSDKVNPFRLLAYLSQQSGILISLSTEVHKFAHRTFQEYLAASYMVGKILEEDDFSYVKKNIEQAPQIWREPCILIGDILSTKKEIGKLWDLIDNLLYTTPPEAPLIDEKFCWKVWLCGRLYLEQNLHMEKVFGGKEWTRSNLKSRLKLAIESSVKFPPKEFSEIGKVLGIFQDDRKGVSGINGLPDIDWCSIPAGKFQMGLTSKQMNLLQALRWVKGSSFEREIPESFPYLNDYLISRFPITEKQFQCFEKAKDGYFQANWWNWSTASFNWFKKIGSKGPEKSDCVNYPNYPRTNTNWYEAVAFCNWISNKIGRSVRLPTEAEWEKAARGIDGRFFPWGNDFDPNKCNSDLTGIGHPCAVGCFHFEGGPWGEDTPLDMCGNVWEWCTTICEDDKNKSIPYPYNEEDGRENMNLGDEFKRVVRGGSYLNEPFVIRCTFRGRDKPFERFLRQGFRVVCAEV